MLVALFALALAAEEPSADDEDEAPAPPADAPAPDAPEAPPWWTSIHIGGFVDVYGSVNVNLPEDRTNFAPGTGSTGKRANELSLNLAELEIAFDAKPVGGKLQLVFGNATQLIHAGEPLGVTLGPTAFDAIYQAYLSVAVPYVDGLVVDGGVFASHIGFEGFFSKDNWNYTRAWLTEYQPFYQTGLRVLYVPPVVQQLLLQLHVLNGWQTIGDVNEMKSLGVSVGWNQDLFSASFNGWAGPELPEDNLDYRLLGDLVLVVRPWSFLHFGASADLGSQFLPGGASLWTGVAGYARVMPYDWLAFAARADTFWDPTGGISGFPQWISEGTLTAEYHPFPPLLLRLEGRGDYSTAAVFAQFGNDATGNPYRRNWEALLFASAVAMF